MTLEDFADFARDALLIVRGGRISYANDAARSLFEECGRTQPLAGAQPEDLWEPEPRAPGPADCLHVRTRTAMSCGLTLHATRQFGVGPDREYALRIVPARQQRLDYLAAAVNEAANAILVIDPQASAYVTANAAVDQVYGLSSRDMMERGVAWVWETLGLGTPAQLADFHAGLIARHPAAETRVLTIRKGGGDATAFVETTRRAIQVDGKWLIVSVNRDVTRERAEHKRLLRLRAAINQTSDGVAVIESTTWNYVEVNEAFGRMFGLSSDDMLARGMQWALANIPGASNIEKVGQDYQALIDTSPAVNIRIREVVREGQPTTYLEVRRYAVHVGGEWLIVGSVRDVSQQMAEQHRLQRLHAAINAAVDGLVIIDPDAMTYLDANEAAARLVGVSREEFLERGPVWVANQSGPVTPDEMRVRHAELIASSPRASTHIFTVYRDGGAAMVEATRRAVRIDGKWLIISVSRDVTDRLRAEERLKRQMQELARSNSDLEQFAYVTSHDLSEPLRMVASYTQLIARRYTNVLDEDGREFMGFVISGAQRMKRLIDDLLAYSRAGRSDARMLPMSLDAPLQDAIENLEYAIEKSGARIERPAQLPEVVCDKTGMTHLFQNLIANALKFKGEQAPVLRIEALQEEGGWTVSVSDNGIGIEAAHFDRIFVVFQRLHARDAYEGTGIGLSICKKIVERHGGRIWVESHPGEGASFRFHLPALAREGS